MLSYQTVKMMYLARIVKEAALLNNLPWTNLQFNQVGLTDVSCGPVKQLRLWSHPQQVPFSALCCVIWILMEARNQHTDILLVRAAQLRVE